MWHELKINKVEKIEKCVAEYQIWMHTILPYGKMKIKIYENQDKTFIGLTDIRIKRKFDGSYEGGVGYGYSIEEALKDTIEWFINVVNSEYPMTEYPNGITEECIKYADQIDF